MKDLNPCLTQEFSNYRFHTFVNIFVQSHLFIISKDKCLKWNMNASVAGNVYLTGGSLTESIPEM